MIDCLKTLFAFLRTKDVKTWRAHRRACVALLPKKEQAGAL